MAASESIGSHHEVAPREALAARLPGGEVGGELLRLLERLKPLHGYELARLVTKRHLISGDGLQVDAILGDDRFIVLQHRLAFVDPPPGEEADRQTRRSRNRI